MMDRPARRALGALDRPLAIACAGWLAALACGQQPPATQPATASRSAQLAALVELIASGDADRAAEAEEELIAAIAGPLSESLGKLSARPHEAQLRVRRALHRVFGTLRLELLRAELPPEDAKALDSFRTEYPRLVERLFDDDYRLRLAALRQIPLVPNTGAGVLIAAKVDDEDADVAMAAVELAAQVPDAATARGLRRFVASALEALETGVYGPGQEDVAVVLGSLVSKSIDVFGLARDADAVPLILRAMEVFPARKLWPPTHMVHAMLSLGEIGDERAVSALLPMLDRADIWRVRPVEAGEPVKQTVGDVALYALLQIYGLPPEELGMVVAEGRTPFAGFAGNSLRTEALRAFRAWHAEHADEPRAQRGKPQTRPVGPATP